MKVLAVLMRIEKLDHAWKWFINKPYVDRVEALGWSLYPICSMAGIASALQVCDALLLPGGYDVQSYYLKEDRNEHVTTYAQPMDHLEFQVIDAFMCNEKPILGICRGMQTLNVYAGGTLLQHIDTQTHAPKQLHTVHSSSRSVLHQLYPQSFTVNSYHHQVAGRLGEGFYTSAFSEENYVEAMEHENGRILFHHFQTSHSMMARENQVPKASTLITVPRSRRDSVTSRLRSNLAKPSHSRNGSSRMLVKPAR